MDFKQIVVFIDNDPSKALRVAAELARTYNASLTACHIVSPLEPVVYGASGVFGSVAEKHLQLMQERADRYKKQVQQVAEQHDVAIAWRQLNDRLVDALRDELLHYDLLVTSPNVTSLVMPILAGAIISTGCPALLVPPDWPRDQLGENVLVAWKPDAVSNRAINGAFPMLMNAASVEVVSFERVPSEEVAERPIDRLQVRLQAQGLAVKAEVVPKVKEPTSWALRSYFENSPADLLVMGCFGHRRLYEWAFGGVTQDLLMKLPIPLLVTH